MSGIDIVDSESSPKAILNWFACSKCHKRFGTPVDVLQHEKKSQCSQELQAKLATTSSTEAVMKTTDDSSPEVNSQLQPPVRTDQGSSKIGHRQQKADINVAPIPVEHQISNPPSKKLSESEPIEDTLQGDSTTKSAIPNDIQTNSIRSIHTNEIGLSIGRPSTVIADTESSDPESNSQASNPHAVNGFKHLDTGIHRLPSTASQPEEPILQVKRTPYVNDYKYNVGSQIFRSHGSPSNRKPSILASKTYDRNTTGIASREPFVIDISSAETQSTKPTEDLSVASDGGQGGRQRSPEDLDEESIAQQVQHEIDSQSYRSLNRNPVLEDDLLGIEHTILPDAINLEKPELVLESLGSIAMDKDGKEMKRKSSDAQLLSPNITKRRQHSNSSDSSRFTQGEQAMQDPSISGRLWRQEHFAARKDFISHPIEEDQMALSPNDGISSPSSQLQDKTSRNSQAESVGIKGEFEDPAMDLSYHSSSAKARRDSELNRSVAPVGSHKPNPVPTSVASLERFHHPQTRHQAADGEQLDVVMLKTDIQDAREVGEEQRQTAAHTFGIEGIQNSPKLTIFDRFKISYPDYSGNMGQFINICNKIRNLVEAGREEHQTLWDDFIVRYNTEYPRYINQCVNMAEDPVPYEQFYRNEVIEARYNKLVVTRKTLNDALSLKHHVLRSPGPPRSPPIVDLTDESKDSPTVQGPNPLPRSEMKPPRSPFPWKGSEKPSGTSYRLDVPTRPFSPSKVLLSDDHSKLQSPSGRPLSLKSPGFPGSLGSSPTKITPAR